MLTGNDRRRLLAAVVELYERAGDDLDGSPAAATRARALTAFGMRLTDAQEVEVAEVRVALIRILAVVEARGSAASSLPSNVTDATLGGAEIVMRCEICAGRDDWLPRLLPSFTYLVTVPLLDREEALRLAALAARTSRKYLDLREVR